MEPVRTSRRKAAIIAALLARLRRSPETTRLLLLLLIWAHVRSRPGYSLVDQPQLPTPDPQETPVPKGRGFSVKRPRTRFL